MSGRNGDWEGVVEECGGDGVAGPYIRPATAHVPSPTHRGAGISIDLFKPLTVMDPTVCKLYKLGIFQNAVAVNDYRVIVNVQMEPVGRFVWILNLSHVFRVCNIFHEKNTFFCELCINWSGFCSIYVIMNGQATAYLMIAGPVKTSPGHNLVGHDSRIYTIQYGLYN